MNAGELGGCIGSGVKFKQIFLFEDANCSYNTMTYQPMTSKYSRSTV